MYNFKSESALVADAKAYVEAAGLRFNYADVQHELLHFVLQRGFTQEDERYLEEFEIGFNLKVPGSSQGSEDGYTAALTWSQELIEALRP